LYFVITNKYIIENILWGYTRFFDRLLSQFHCWKWVFCSRMCECSLVFLAAKLFLNLHFDIRKQAIFLRENKWNQLTPIINRRFETRLKNIDFIVRNGNDFVRGSNDAWYELKNSKIHYNALLAARQTRDTVRYRGDSVSPSRTWIRDFWSIFKEHGMAWWVFVMTPSLVHAGHENVPCISTSIRRAHCLSVF